MSARLMGMAFKTGIPRGQRFVLVKLCDCANDEGLCYPSQETVAEDTGFGETAVQQHIKWLKENNFIKSARRQRGRERQSDIYRINVALLEKCYAEAAKRKAERRAKMREEPSDFEPSDFEPSDFEPSDFEPSDFGSKNPQILSHEPSDFGGSLYEEPSVEPSIEPSGLNARAAHAPADHAETGKRAEAAKPKPAKPTRHETELALLATHGITGQEAEDFLQIRKAKRQPLTETAMRLIAGEAEKCGMTAWDAVLYAIGNGWGSFRAEWLQNKTFGSAAQAAKPNRINDIPAPMKGGAYLAKDVL
ncbi:helix-turn-helix domain-containing protein [Neisseria elongata]|uniref:helix-turn-helix domain-containing protein n=1 Tax=Neisseria elongata TaxID=495 RepID=UPI000E0CEDB3|nr:helix-turn-helix domain-containing protein [Neisseria elongata]